MFTTYYNYLFISIILKIDHNFSHKINFFHYNNWIHSIQSIESINHSFEQICGFHRSNQLNLFLIHPIQSIEPIVSIRSSKSAVSIDPIDWTYCSWFVCQNLWFSENFLDWNQLWN